jgi:predicted transcriptional regulator
MEEDRATHEADPRLVTRIVGSYVRHHKIGVDQLAGLIAEVNRTLGGLRRAAPPEEALVPAVPIKRSVGRDAVVCLECGFRNQMLRRHLRTAHGLEATAYRSRWNLSADHPLTAPSYSSRRSALAKGYGFGRKRQVVVSAPAPAIAAALPKRRGRPPKSPAATA